MKLKNGQLSIVSDRLTTWTRVKRAHQPVLSYRTLKCNDVFIVIGMLDHVTIRALTKFGVVYIHKNDFLIEHKCG